MFDSRAGSLRSGMAVLVEGTRIVSVESAVGIARRPNDVRIEAEGCTLLPGLIDAHVHLCMDGGTVLGPQRPSDPAVLAVIGAASAMRTVKHGVTAVRCVGTPANVDLVIRDAIEQRRLVGPRIVAAGRPIATTGGHGYSMALEADGVDAVIAAVRSQVRAGVDVVKLMVTGGVLTPGGRPGMPQMLRDEIEAAIQIAHRANRRVCGHAEGPEGVRDAVVAGIDSIEHGYFDEGDPLFEQMRTSPTYLVPTLVAYAAIVEGKDELAADAVANAERAIERHKMSFRSALHAGVPIAMGSDAGTPFNPHGENWREIEHMVNQGMKPAAAIQAATLGGASLLGLEDTGVIEPGMTADLLLVEGNPVDDLASLANVRAVWSQGSRIPLDHGAVA